MTKGCLALMVATAMSVAGCSTVSEGEYKTFVAAVGSSPKLQQHMRADCVNKSRKWTADEREFVALLANTTAGKAGPVVCQRIVSALARNKISYRDAVSASSSAGEAARFLRVIQGKA